jgi:hypothetical protein
MTIRLPHHRKYDLHQQSRPCRFHPPSITTNESSRLVGWFLQPPSSAFATRCRVAGPPSPFHHQRVIATRWLVPAASISLRNSLPGRWASITLPPPPTSHRDSLAGSCSLHQPSTTTESSQLVGGSFGLHQPSTTTNESLRLVGGFFI